MGDLGTRFRLARENKNVSLQQAEQDTRIRRKYLQALEDEDWASLPPAVYVKGFVRNYASYLGLDPSEMLESCHAPAGQPPPEKREKPEESQGEEAPAPKRPAPPLSPPPPATSAAPSVKPTTRPLESRSWRWLNLLLGAGLLLVVILAAYLLLTSSAYQDLVRPATPSVSPVFPSRTSASVTAVASASPTSKAPGETPTPVTTVTPTVEVRIYALPDSYGCWLEVYVDGREDFRGLLQPGETRTWIGRDRITMHVGNAGGLEATVNGQPQGLLGAPGQVVDVEWTRPGAGPAPSATPLATQSNPGRTPGAPPGATSPSTPSKSPTITPTPTAPAVTSTPTPTRPPTPTGTPLPTSPAATPTP